MFVFLACLNFVIFNSSFRGHSFATFLVDKLHLHRVRLFIVAYGYIIRAKILRSIAKVAIKYENIVSYGEIFAWWRNLSAQAWASANRQSHFNVKFKQKEELTQREFYKQKVHWLLCEE